MLDTYINKPVLLQIQEINNKVFKVVMIKFEVGLTKVMVTLPLTAF